MTRRIGGSWGSPNGSVQSSTPPVAIMRSVTCSAFPERDDVTRTVEL
jgi:hypothetical protein